MKQFLCVACRARGLRLCGRLTAELFFQGAHAQPQRVALTEGVPGVLTKRARLDWLSWLSWFAWLSGSFWNFVHCRKKYVKAS